MTDRYQEIRDALAMGPTPGPWELKDGRTDTIENAQGYPVCTVHHHPYELYGHGARAAYITACDPDTIRELLEERDALRERVGQLEYSNAVNADAKAQAAKHAEEVDRLREQVKELEADATKYRWGINNARWIRGEQEAYVAVPVASDADLSCVAMRDAAIDAAMEQEAGRG